MGFYFIIFLIVFLIFKKNLYLCIMKLEKGTKVICIRNTFNGSYRHGDLH